MIVGRRLTMSEDVGNFITDSGVVETVELAVGISLIAALASDIVRDFMLRRRRSSEGQLYRPQI